MFIILTKSFLKREFKSLNKHYKLEDLKKTLKKINSSSICLANLGYKDGKLLKLRITSNISGRLVVYLFEEKNLIIPVVLRLKKDKIFGENLSFNNEKAKSLILDMLDRVMVDIKSGDYEKIQIK